MTEQRYRGGQYGERMRLLTPEEQRRKQLGLLYDVASFAPVTGEAISAKEAKEYYDEGRYGMMSLAALGALPVVGPLGRGAVRSGRALLETPAMSTPKNLINQAVANMPTTIKGFYHGKPIRSFTRDFIKEIPDAINTRTDAAQRAFQDLWGISTTKVADILGRGKPAQKEIKKHYREADLLAEAGLNTAANKVRAQGDRLAQKTGQDSEFTAMSIEAQMSPTIIPVEQRGALANSVYGLNYHARALGRSDVSEIGKQIGNANRLDSVEKIPDKITGYFVNHLVNGPHVKRQQDLYEYQIKTLDSSRAAGLVESEGYGKKGSMLARAFNAGSKESKVPTSFQSYRDFVTNITKKDDIAPEEAVDFLQLAATMTNDNVTKINKALGGGSKLKNKALLDGISASRVALRAGKKITPTQQKRLDVFENLVKRGKITLARVSDDTGNAVGGLDFNSIQKPKGPIKTQTSYHSQQKELGGVNQMVVMDIENKTNYSMLSDGHDIFDEQPLNGHHLISAQPITQRGWNEKGFTPQHRSKADFNEIEKSLNDTAKRVGVKLPENLNRSNFDNASDYYDAAEEYTDELMQRSVAPTGEQVAQAQSSQKKWNAAKTTGMLTGAGTVYGTHRAFADDE